MKEIVFIYGLYDRFLRCRYVGQTTDTESRRVGHLHATRAKFRGTGWKLKIIRITTLENANRIERQIGIAYQKTGQAERSVRFHKRAIRKPSQCGPLIYVDGFDSPFSGVTAAAAFLNCSPQTVARNIGGEISVGDEYRMISDKPIGIDFVI
jgi:hypothetical protein